MWRRIMAARKLWCSVARLMSAGGLRGAARGRRLVTTRPDPTAVRAPDLVRRDFSAARPNQRWLIDFTYVPTWSGTKFTAFVSDAYFRRIVGWRTAATMPIQLPLDALKMALWTRAGPNSPSTG
jgi:putative transposase